MNIGIPVINRGDLLEACINSIDEPTDRVVIIANRWNGHYEPSVERALNHLVESHPGCIGSLEIFETGGNLGAGGSYNQALTILGPCIIAANDTRFSPGVLGRCIRFITERKDDAIHFLYAGCVFSVTRVFMEEIGWFDENFWPWGWDDIDVGYRMKKKGLPTSVFTKAMGTIFHDHPTQSIFSSPEPLRKWMQRTSGKNRDYGMHKWAIREEHLGMLNKDNKWAIDPAVIRDAGNEWSLDLELRRQRIESLRDEVSIDAPLCFCRMNNGDFL